MVSASMAAAPRPCSARAATSSSRVGATPHSREAVVNSEDAGQQQPAAADEVAEPAGADDQGGDGEQVGQDDPLDLLEGGTERLGHRRQPDVGDAGGEGGQQHRQREAGQRGPGPRARRVAHTMVLTPHSSQPTHRIGPNVRAPAELAEAQSLQLIVCSRRHVRGALCHRRRMAPSGSQPARHARRAARGGQRHAGRSAPAAQPLGDEPGSGPTAQGDRRPAAGAGRTWARAHTARARAAGAGPRAGSARGGGAAPRRRGPTSPRWCGRSRCGPATASSRVSARSWWPGSASRRRACSCASCASPTSS